MHDILSTLPQKPTRRFLNTDSLLAYCRDTYDLPISRVTLYREQRAGRLHPLKRGGRLLFSIAEVQQWIEGSNAGDPSVTHEQQEA
ncbi:MAG: helix-turn-helix domain-containing protein [Chlorobium phaeovibrioides]|nr:helix-turn-helix domain-containing protein [Chlorobium phaeovibrioides]